MYEKAKNLLKYIFRKSGCKRIIFLRKHGCMRNIFLEKVDVWKSSYRQPWFEHLEGFKHLNCKYSLKGLDFLIKVAYVQNAIRTCLKTRSQLTSSQSFLFFSQSCSVMSCEENENVNAKKCNFAVMSRKVRKRCW